MFWRFKPVLFLRKTNESNKQQMLEAVYKRRSQSWSEGGLSRADILRKRGRNFFMVVRSSVARGGQWGHALRGASEHFLQSFKNAFYAAFTHGGLTTRNREKSLYKSILMLQRSGDI